MKTRRVHAQQSEMSVSTHPVDIDVTLWDDVGVEKGGFTGCKREGLRSEGLLGGDTGKVQSRPHMRGNQRQQ